MKIIGFAAVASCALALTLTGCASNCVQIASAGTEPSKVATAKGDVRISSPASTLSGDLVVAKVVLENQSDDTQSVQYQYQWFDNQGYNVGENTPWEPVVITPNSSRVVSAVAPSANATRFNVLVCR